MDAVLTSAKYSLYSQLEEEFESNPVVIDNTLVIKVSHAMAAYMRESFKDMKSETDNVKYVFESANEYSSTFEELKDKV